MDITSSQPPPPSIFKIVLKNLFFQLIFGLTLGIFLSYISSILVRIFVFKYGGLDFFDLVIPGNKSPFTLALIYVFTILEFGFPLAIFLLLAIRGSLKKHKKFIKFIFLLVFISVPFLPTRILSGINNLKGYYGHYQSVRTPCVIKNGVNKTTYSDGYNEFECENGVLNGFAKRYNAKGVLVSEKPYLNGEINGIYKEFYDSGNRHVFTHYAYGREQGPEIYYNEDGNTNLYIINDKNRSKQIYFQRSEKDISEQVSPSSQAYLCNHQNEGKTENYRFTCNVNVINGQLLYYTPSGNLMLRADLNDGVLNGIYEVFSIDNKLLKSHLEFRNGKLNGKIYSNNSEGTLEYEGVYVNGLQEGTFKSYDYKKNLEYEVVFSKGDLVKIVHDDILFQNKL